MGFHYLVVKYIHQVWPFLPATFSPPGSKHTLILSRELYNCFLIFSFGKMLCSQKVTITKSYYHTAYRHLRNTKNKFNCENIKMICNFVVLSMFEIFIFNPNQKREKINKNRKKNMQNLHNLTKFMSFLFLAYNFFLFFKFQRCLGGLFLLFMSIFLTSLFFTSYMVRRRWAIHLHTFPSWTPSIWSQLHPLTSITYSLGAFFLHEALSL